MYFFKRSVLFTALLFFLTKLCFAQQDPYPSAIMEYVPAPGQFINDPLSGTPEKAALLTSGDNNVVSLGAYGGYIVFKFDDPVENHPDNPYGIDFLIAGNAFGDSSEPGIVSVMTDTNGNGIPDDVWYELAGSRHHGIDVERNYSITYLNTADSKDGDIFWKDIRGDSSYIYHNSFHPQDYYPSGDFFPDYDQDSISFQGSILHVKSRIEDGILRTERFLFGYADCNPVDRTKDISLPDNPYTPDITEGYGGDAFDISWAVDAEGNYVDPEKVHFIRVYTAANNSIGSLGEISTEISALADIPPSAGTAGITKLISMENIPDVIPLGAEIPLNGIIFDRGKPFGEKILYSVSDTEIASIDDSTLIAKKGGDFILSAVAFSDPSIKGTKQIHVVRPSLISLSAKFSFLPEGSTGNMEAYIVDQDGKKIEGVYPSLTIADTGIAVIQKFSAGRFIISAKKAGKTKVTAVFVSEDTLINEISIEVLPYLPSINVSFTLQIDDKNIIPGKIFTVDKYDFSSFIDRASKPAGNSPSIISLAEVMAKCLYESGYNEGGNKFRFRLDEYGGNKLYLWQVGSNWEFWYGWGGYNEEPEFSSRWAVNVNDTIYLNDFDNIRIADGDRISVFYLPEQPETFTKLYLYRNSGSENADISDTVFFQLQHYETDEYQRLYLSDASLPPDQQVFFDNEPAGMLYDLTEQGMNYFIPDISSGRPDKIWLENYPGEVLWFNGNVSGIKYNNIPEGIEIFPVPFRDILRVRTAGARNSFLKICNMQGRQVYQAQLFTDGELSMNLGFLDKGIYIVTIITAEGAFNKMVIKE